MISKEYTNTMQFLKNASVIDGGFISRHGNLLGGAKGRLRVNINGTSLILARVMFFYHHGAFPTKIKYRDGNERNININNLGTCKWLEEKIQMAKDWNGRILAGGNRYNNDSLNKVYHNELSECQKFKQREIETTYEEKFFGDIFFGDLFKWKGTIYKKIEPLNYTANAINEDDVSICLPDNLMVLDISNPIEKEVEAKITPEEAGKHIHSKSTYLIKFKKVKLKEEFTTRGDFYIKQSHERLPDGSNATRMDGSTAYMSDDRKVEVYR